MKQKSLDKIEKALNELTIMAETATGDSKTANNLKVEIMKEMISINAEHMKEQRELLNGLTRL